MADFGTLGLPGVELLSHVDDLASKTLRLKLRQLPEPKWCRVCGEEMQGHGWTPKRGVVDSRAMNRRVKLDIEQQRVKCKGETCQRTAVVGLSFLHPEFKMTQRLFTELQTIFTDLGRRFDSVAVEIGMSEKTSRTVFGSIAREHEQQRFKWARLGDTVWIAGTVLNQQPRFLVVNVEQRTLAELTATVEEEELLALLTRLGKPQMPLRVWIPAQRGVRNAVKQAFKNCRIGLTQGAINQVLARTDKDLAKIKNMTARKAAERAILSVLDPVEVCSGYVGDSPRERLRRVAQEDLGGPLQWLAAWLVEWEEEVLDSQVLTGHAEGLTTMKNLGRVVRLLNVMGNGYSFDVLRQRLLYTLDQVWAYRPPDLSDGMAYVAYSREPILLKRLTEYRIGKRVGTFGVSIERVLSLLERAALEAPQTLPEDNPDDD